MATTSISALSPTGTIDGDTVGPFDYSGATYKVTANTLGAFITTNAVTVSATGNITGGNLLFGAGIISGTGTVSAAGTVLTGNISAAGYQGGASGLSITGNVTGGNLLTGGLISATGNISTGSQFFTVGNAGIGTATPGSRLEVSQSDNSEQGIIIRNATSSTVAGAMLRYYAGTDTAAIIRFPAGHSAKANELFITNVGNTSPITFATQDIERMRIDSAGNLSVAGTVIVNSRGNATAIVNGAANAVGNIGSASTYFNQLFAQATTALYADLAEVYEADADYAPGTVVSFGGTKEVTVSVTERDPTVAGVISANPSYLMNNGLTADHRAIVALTGRVHTSVTGAVTKGAMMVTAGNGHARASAAPAMGTVIGKALENFDGESGIIEIVVGRM